MLIQQAIRYLLLEILTCQHFALSVSAVLLKPLRKSVVYAPYSERSLSEKTRWSQTSLLRQGSNFGVIFVEKIPVLQPNHYGDSSLRSEVLSLLTLWEIKNLVLLNLSFQYIWYNIHIELRKHQKPISSVCCHLNNCHTLMPQMMSCINCVAYTICV